MKTLVNQMHPNQMAGWLVVLLLSLLSGGCEEVMPILPHPGAEVPYELWVLDQGTNSLLIYDGASLSPNSRPEIVNLASYGGSKPHTVMFSPQHDHVLIANVASGHVYIMHTSDRQVVFNEDTGLQAHAAVPSPDGKRALVANQNDKKLTEILTDYQNGVFRVGRVLDLEKAPELSDATEFPDRAPICLTFTASSSKAYVPLRGGGIVVVSTPSDESAPLTVVKGFGKVRDGIDAAGCGAMRSADGKWIYANSGNATGGKFYVFDPQEDTLISSVSLTSVGRDSHGVVLVGRYIWVTNRLSDNAAILDSDGGLIGKLETMGDAPDMMDISPTGERVFVTLRGPSPATGGHDAAGMTPGVAVFSVRDGGRTGAQEFFIPIGDQSPQSPNDLHGIAVRWKGR